MVFSPALSPVQLYGIGHAMVDMYAVLPPNAVMSPDSPLPSVIKASKAVHLDEGAMDALVQDVQAQCKDRKSTTTLFCKTAGGTTANILRTAARLGGRCFFSGSTGTGVEGKRDKDAFFFQKECARAGVNAHLVSNSGITGRCLAIYSEHSKTKAIAASPSAARGIEVEQVSENEIMKANCIVIEGMLFFNVAAYTRVLKLCKSHSEYEAFYALRFNQKQCLPKLLAVDVASSFVAPNAVMCLANAVENGLIAANQLLIFANEQEYKVIQRKAKSDISYLLQSGAMIIVKCAEKGAKLYWHDTILKETAQVQPVLDDTGAGDAFAGGFLTHFLAHYAAQTQGEACINEKFLRACLKAGNEVAATVLENYGCTGKT